LGFQVLGFGGSLEGREGSCVAFFVEFQKGSVGLFQAESELRAGDGTLARVSGELIVFAHDVDDGSGEGLGMGKDGAGQKNEHRSHKIYYLDLMKKFLGEKQQRSASGGLTLRPEVGTGRFLWSRLALLPIH